MHAYTTDVPGQSTTDEAHMNDRTDMPDIGGNVARIRREQGLSLEELSNRSGVSTGMLSQIEKDKVNPTVAVVWKIAAGFGVPFHELFSRPDERPLFSVTRHDETVILERDGGRVVFRILSPLTMAEKLELYVVTIAPGGVLKSSAHAPGTEEFLTVLEGAATATVEDRRADLSPGDTVHFHADLIHIIRNESASDCRCYLVVKYP